MPRGDGTSRYTTQDRQYVTRDGVCIEVYEITGLTEQLIDDLAIGKTVRHDGGGSSKKRGTVLCFAGPTSTEDILCGEITDYSWG